MNEALRIIGISGICLSFICLIASIIFIPIWTEKKLNLLRIERLEERKEIIELIKSIETEMKDFHYQILKIKRDQNEKQKGQ